MSSYLNDYADNFSTVTDAYWTPKVANVASQRQVLTRTKAPKVSAQYLTYGLSFPCANMSENNTLQFFRHIH